MPAPGRLRQLFFPAVIFGLAACLVGCAAGGTGAGHDAGPSGVGFRSFWAFDYARTYRTGFDDGQTYGAVKSPRPVLVNVWYPGRSDGPRMTHGEYLLIESADPRLRALSAQLAAYQREVIDSEWGTGEEGAAEAIATALSRRRAAVRDAAPAHGRFPVVIYHGGAGSSIDDNALLCERLAAEGFLVIGAAFQQADGSSFNVDASNAGREVEFLLRLAADMGNADLARVGAVGHSAGAQGLLMYAARPGIALDAIVSLDTTQDYRTLRDPRWSLLVATLETGRDSFSTPTLFVAGPSAIFALGDTLDRSQRTYLTIPGLSHNEYVSQGEIAAALRARSARDSAENAAAPAREVRAAGERLRSLVTLYLSARLRGDRAAWRELETLQAAGLATQPHVEIVEPGGQPQQPPGATASPRSVFLAFERAGADGAIAELSRSGRLDARLFTDEFAFQLLYDLAASNRLDDARRLSDFFLTRGVDARRFMVPQVDLFASLRRFPEFVGVCVRLGRVIADDDPQTREMVRKYGLAPSDP